MGEAKSARWANRRDWTPEELAILVEMTAKRARDAEIGERLNRSENSVCMRRLVMGLLKGRNQMRAVPDDFREVAPGRPTDWLREYYGCGYKSIRAWRIECGIVVARPVAKAKAVKAPRLPRASKTTSARKQASWNIPRQSIYRVEAESSLSSMAAQHLRRKGFSNIYRATILDKPKRAHLPDEGRYYYAVSGRGLMHEADVIALAARYGFSIGQEFAA